MTHELDELNKVIQEGLDMEALMKDDKFKAFYERVTKELRINLVAAINTPDDKKKEQVLNQMTFSAGLENYVIGTIQAGEMCKAELDQLNAENEEGVA